MVQGWEVFIFALVSVTFLLLLYKGVLSNRVPVHGPSLSLLLIVRDMEESIEGLIRQIHGFRQRTSFSFDIVVVDDSSQDQTREILNYLSFRCPLVIASSDQFKSPLESGVFHCQGQLICILDLVGRFRPKEAAAALESFFGLAKSRCRSR